MHRAKAAYGRRPPRSGGGGAWTISVTRICHGRRPLSERTGATTSATSGSVDPLVARNCASTSPAEIARSLVHSSRATRTMSCRPSIWSTTRTIKSPARSHSPAAAASRGEKTRTRSPPPRRRARNTASRSSVPKTTARTSPTRPVRRPDASKTVSARTNPVSTHQTLNRATWSTIEASGAASSKTTATCSGRFSSAPYIRARA